MQRNYSPRQFLTGVPLQAGWTRTCKPCISAQDYRNWADAFKCCLFFQADFFTEAMNAKAREVAAAHGLLLVDQERLLEGQAPETYLFDCHHLHFNYMAVFVNLALAAVASSAS